MSDLVVVWPYLLLSMGFGVLVGLVELLGRYRDEPKRVLTGTWAPFWYMAFNALISGAAFGFLRHFADKILPAAEKDPLIAALAAGFGSMVVLRSKLITIKGADGKDVAVGPDIVVAEILRVFDQQMDRHRSAQRMDLVKKETMGIVDANRMGDYLLTALASFQNLNNADRVEITQTIERVLTTTLDQSMKILALGYGFLNIAGEETFKTTMEGARAYAVAAPVPSPPPLPPPAPPPPPSQP
jgi:hypothetical protein